MHHYWEREPQANETENIEIIQDINSLRPRDAYMRQ